MLCSQARSTQPYFEGRLLLQDKSSPEGEAYFKHLSEEHYTTGNAIPRLCDT